MSDIVKNNNGVVVINSMGGHTVISKESPLKRLHYFDGKFLRAVDLNLEQQALLHQVRLSNQASGSGVVHGFSCALAGGDRLDVGPGLAIDPDGRVLHMPQEIRVGIAELIEKSRKSLSVAEGAATAALSVFGECELAAEEAPETILERVRIYLITVGHAEAYCGEEDVYGKLCEEACITSTERPYIIEGVVIRAMPLTLPAVLAASQAIAFSSKHMRSRVASAYFSVEQRNPASLISGEGLSSPIWCQGAEAAGGAAVPIAVMARAGEKTIFLDAWIARREGMETPPRRYWAGRMAMRPWNVFLAQILQFQCQLASCFAKGNVSGDIDPCEEEKKLAREASKALTDLLEQYAGVTKRFANMEAISRVHDYLEIAPLRELQKNLAAVAVQAISRRSLINCGIIELPSAGYLPISPSSTITVNEQVRRLMGQGVDLRYCSVRPDYIPHVLEEAQHMERISLLAGIDDPAAKPKVDILVPDGRIEEYKEEAPGTGYEMKLVLHEAGLTKIINALISRLEKHLIKPAREARKNSPSQPEVPKAALDVSILHAALRGAARGEDLGSGGTAFYYAAQTPETTAIPVNITPRDYPLAAVSTGSSVEKTRLVREASTNPTRQNEQPLTTLRQQPSQAIWLSLRTNKDPFELGDGDATQVSVQVVFTNAKLPSNSLWLTPVDISVDGLLRVEDIGQHGNDARRLTCRLKAKGAFNFFIEQSGKRIEQTIRLSLYEKVTILRKTTDCPQPSYWVRVINPSIWAGIGNTELGFERVWKDSSTAEIKASLSVTQLDLPQISHQKTAPPETAVIAEKKELPIFNGLQKINNDVLKPANPLHTASLSALARLGTAQNDKSFADFAARQLFPPPKPVPDELRVFARRDWVLFHRRRDIVCGFDKMPEALVQPRRFRVFHTSVANDKERTLLRDALLNNRPETINSFKPQPVTIVAFEAGIQSVRTSHDYVRADWQQVQVHDDADIVLGVVATRGAAYDEGQPLAEARLNSLTDVLEPVAEFSENAELFWAAQVPDTLANGEVDGVIIYATQRVTTVCHKVYRVEIAENSLDNFIRLSGSPKLSHFLQKYNAQKLDYIPKFRSKTKDLFGKTAAIDLQTAWGNKGNLVPYHALTLFRSVINQTLSDQHYADQAQTIATTLGAPFAIDLKVKEVNHNLLECPAVTILVVEPLSPPIYNDVYVILTPRCRRDDLCEDKQILEEFKETLEETGFPEEFQTTPNMYPLGRVEFGPNNKPKDSSLNSMINTAISKNLLDQKHNPNNNLTYLLFSLSKNGSGTNQTARDKVQAGCIRDALNLNGNNVTEAIHGKEHWPTTGTAMTLVVVVIPKDDWPRVAAPLSNLYAYAKDIADEDVVTTVSEKMSYDILGNLIKNPAFEETVARLKKDGIVLKNIEQVMTEEPEEGATDTKTEALLAALKEAGVAEESATVKLRIANDKERKLISRLGTGVSSGLVLRK
ncbi:hypothetical protein [Desulfogranum marinum]|uniref:hypothetical protein n=1 Tax=Desulfogranum marinum TaxID=453220 RepID=UPI0029C6C3DE|nr:hypothetical protein [Desulfogranum marinum]